MASLFMNQEDRTRAVEQLFGYTFEDPSLLHKALHLAGSGGSLDGNKSLAQVGDAVLRLALVSEGYEKGMAREHTSRIVDRVGGNDMLTSVGFLHKLDKLVYKNPSQLGGVPPKPMACTVEALLGAVYLDSSKSIDTVRQVMSVLGLVWPELAN
ncbi:hypothetical protein AJ80_09534 [Polytolypa hystricis UAMH7299]|uniref:RNase III domain-containing protein n=1 Tax=Polytolypa hystricis (strain UAMH7299) TaxID=1447883 RepID=A0A2B7WGL4_POLH7|nr:hypothetical protein AJ80_09534 [Polytolypa hystricis UAMH7299]